MNTLEYTYCNEILNESLNSSKDADGATVLAHNQTHAHIHGYTSAADVHDHTTAIDKHTKAAKLHAVARGHASEQSGAGIAAVHHSAMQKYHLSMADKHSALHDEHAAWFEANRSSVRKT